jgi:site-specific DNA-methyltransferase (adenine-specific)
MQTPKIDLLNIDCMDYMAGLDYNAFDLAIVDPPYGINVNISMGKRKGNKKSDYHKFAGDDVEPPSAEYFTELRRISKNQIIWGANHFISKFEFNADSPCWMMWDKKFSDKITFAQFELAWTSFKTTCKKFDQSPNDKYRIHPTQKPIRLYDWLLQNYAKPEMKILDTHLGSGSSAIAAHYFGCDFVGCEIDRDYFESAKKRFDKETRQNAFEYAYA